RLVRIAHVLAQVGEQLVDLGRRGVAHGVRNVDGGGAGGDGGAEDFNQEFGFGTQRVFGGEFDVSAVFARMQDGSDGGVQYLLLAHAELVLAMQRTGGEKQVNAGSMGAFQCACGGVDVAGLTSRQR